MSIDVRRVDPADEGAVRDWWETLNATNAERPFNPTRPFELSLTNLRTPDADHSQSVFVATDGGRVVGAGRAWLPLADNRHLAHLHVAVPSGGRGRGVGSAVLEQLEAHARAAGRRTFMAEVPTLGGQENAGVRFAVKHGYVEATREENKVVDLTTAVPTWPTLDDEVAARIGDYRIVTVLGPIPDEYVDGYCDMVSTFSSMIPVGDLDFEQWVVSPERLRRDEAREQSLGRERVAAIGIAPDGEVCATSDLNLVVADPRQAYIGITMVLPDHRGHALGLGLKLASHRALLEAFPTCTQVSTSNANVNQYMNSINERMGYRVVEQTIEVQKQL